MNLARGDFRSQALPLFLRRAQMAGEDVTPLWREFGLPRDASDRWELQMPLGAAQALTDRIAEVVKDDLFGVHLAYGYTRVYGAMEHAMRRAPTLRAFCEICIRHSGLLCEHSLCTLDEARGEVRLRLRIPGAARCYGRHANEFVVTYLHRLIADRMPTGWAPRRVWFAHEAPDQASRLVNVFRTDRMEFDEHGYLGLSFDPSDLDVAAPELGPELSPRLGSDVDLPQQVRAAIGGLLAKGEPPLEIVAAQLGLGPRTLQRRLHDLDLNFQTVLEEVRMDLALRLLRDPRPTIKEIAFDLGYTTVGNFARAFQRWTGSTPIGYRAGHARG